MRNYNEQITADLAQNARHESGPGRNYCHAHAYSFLLFVLLYSHVLPPLQLSRAKQGRGNGHVYGVLHHRIGLVGVGNLLPSGNALIRERVRR
jgi:hypothetical protein